MATIIEILETDRLVDSRADLNSNFTALNAGKVDGAAALLTAGRLVEVASAGVATQTSFASAAVLLSTGTYADPAWLTSLATSKLSGTVADTNLAATAVTPAAYGAAASVATFTVDQKGRITAAASVSIAIAASQVTSGTFDNARVASSNVTQHQAALSVAWSQLTSIPSTFTPAAHVHSGADITTGTIDNARTTAVATNTTSTIVARDASGNFAAGTITATFSGNLTGNVTGNASGTAATITGALALANTPLTTRGDILLATTATPILGRLAKGTQYQSLLGGATDPTWGAVDLAQASAVTGLLPLGNGGTGATTLAGAGIVAGSASITTANALLIGASAGVLGQSDATFVSGVLTRAGTVGLSATGANVVTVSTNGVERGRWSSNGYFGVGTNAPLTLMHLVGDEQLTLQRSSANAFGFALDFIKSRGTAGSPADVADGDTISWIRSAPYSGSYKYLNSMVVAVDGTFTSTQNPPTSITFYTNAENGSATERIRIKNNGNILVGTTTDDGLFKLQVANDIHVKHATAAGRIRFTGGTDANVFDIQSDNDGFWFRGLANESMYWQVNSQTMMTLGAPGTLTLYNPVAVTGVTALIVRAGAGQSTTALQKWSTNANFAVASVVNDSGWPKFRLTNANASEQLELAMGTSTAYIQTTTNHAITFLANSTERIKINNTGIGFFGVTPVARQTALTAAEAGALNTGDAGSDTVISNIRTRLGELETKMQAYGLLQ